MENNEEISKKLDKSIWKDLGAMLLLQKKTIIKVFIPLLLTAFLDTMFPLLNSYAIDYLATGNASNYEFIGFIALYFIIIIVFGIAVYYYLHFTGIVENNLAYELREQSFSKVQELSFSFFDKNSDGWIISRLTSDINRITEILSWGLIDSLFGFATMIVITIVMFLVNAKLALMVLAVTPLIVVISFWFQKRILMKQREVRKHNSEVTAAIAENINGAKTVKSLAIEDAVKDEFYEITGRMRKSAIQANILSSLFIPIVIFLSGVSTALVIWYGGEEVARGAMAFGILMMFVSYINQFFQPLREIARLIAEMQMAQASAERVLQLINTENEVVDSKEVIEKYGTILEPKKEAYPELIGDVEFKNVDFYYNESEPVLKDFNLKIKQGQTVALVGETGSGKSTIINLICRFYEPKNGEILIDGIDYRERSLGWLRENIGYVLQTPHLFSGSIKENIRYGKLDATDDEIIEAAKRVNAHEFITNFSEGYNTDVGEGGGRLSTGQKQLISFARAIIKNPSIFILDEATASIDTETEYIVQKAISELLKDKTSFIVAHRLSTIVDSDLILVIKQGEIVERGTHLELLALKGYYYRLYTNQFNESLSDRILSKKA